MSWSATAVGRPASVKEKLANQFTQAKQQTAGIPAESESVALVEQLVNKQLDFAVEHRMPAVSVQADGSAAPGANTPDRDYSGSIQVRISVTPIYGFLD